MTGFLKLKTSILVIGLLTGCNNSKEVNSMKEYDILVNRAENHIVNMEYKKALNTYKRIKTNFNPFIKEKINAFICSTATNDYERSYDNAKILILSGVPFEYFEMNCFMNFQSSIYFNKLKQEYNNLHNKYLLSIEKALVYKLKELVEEDQSTYCELPEKKVTQSDVMLQTTEIDSILSKLVKEYGFFTESNTGINIKEDGTISIFPFYFVLYRHSYQSQGSFFRQHILEAHKRGQIATEVFENIFENDQFKILEINGEILVNKKFYNDIKIKHQLAKLQFLEQSNLPFLIIVPFSKFESTIFPKNIIDAHFINTNINITGYE
jgi:hypothetical protein